MKIKPLMTLIFMLMAISIVIAQQASTEKISIAGQVSDKSTHQLLAYVSVGVLNKPQGTVSDSLGKFSFSISNEYYSDTLQISMVGYYPVRISVRDFMNASNKNIQLAENISQLSDVIVQSGPSKTNTEIIGKQSTGKFTQVSIHNKSGVEETIGSEMGMRYKIEKPDALLKNFNFYISANNFNSIKFRINIYSVKNDLPDNLICNKQIITNLDNFKTGWTKVDLESFTIKVKEDIIVTVQWVESRMDKKEIPVTIVPVTMTLFAKNCYVRVASQDKWKRMGMKVSSFITIAY